jgi:hypothetical protein
MRSRGFFVKLRRLALLKRDSGGRANAEAIAEPVAIVVAREFRLAASDRYRALAAHIRAQSAAVA